MRPNMRGSPTCRRQRRKLVSMMHDCQRASALAFRDIHEGMMAVPTFILGGQKYGGIDAGDDLPFLVEEAARAHKKR